jgi:hypothetical protein
MFDHISRVGQALTNKCAICNVERLKQHSLISFSAKNVKLTFKVRYKLSSQAMQ